MADCSGCRAYLLAEQAGALLSTCQSEHRLAAVLLHGSDVLCYRLRSANCCGVNTRSGQFMIHSKEPVPVAWPVFRSVAIEAGPIPHLVAGDN